MKLFSLLLMFSTQILLGQTEPEFVAVKKRFAEIQNLLDEDLRRLYPQAKNQEDKSILFEQYNAFKYQIDSAQNSENTYALIAYKTRRQLERLKIEPTAKDSLKQPDINEQEAFYPGGLQKLRDEISQKVYSANLEPLEKKLETTISFEVLANGSLWVKSTDGPNLHFNRQAEIAVYCLEQKFQPAIINRKYANSFFKIPLKLIFD
jgi:hypothetical protein